jgi:hypothetical protein
MQRGTPERPDALNQERLDCRTSTWTRPYIVSFIRLGILVKRKSGDEKNEGLCAHFPGIGAALG